MASAPVGEQAALASRAVRVAGAHQVAQVAARVPGATGVAQRVVVAEEVRRARTVAMGPEERVVRARDLRPATGRAVMRTKRGAGQLPLEVVRAVGTAIPAVGQAAELVLVDRPPAGEPIVGAVHPGGRTRGLVAPVENARGPELARHGPERLARVQRVQVLRLRVPAGPGARPVPVAPASVAGATSALGADPDPAVAKGEVLVVAVRLALARVVLAPEVLGRVAVAKGGVLVVAVRLALVRVVLAPEVLGRVARPIAVAMIVVRGPGPRAEPSVPRGGPSRRRQRLSFGTQAAREQPAVAPALRRRRCGWCAARVGPPRRRRGVATRT